MEQHFSWRFGVATLFAAAMLLGCQPSQPEESREISADEAPPVSNAVRPEPRMPPDIQAPLSSDMPARDATVVDTVIDEVTFSTEGDAEQNTLGPPATSFAPQDPVYAEVRTTGTADAYTIYAKWIDPNGVVLADYGIRVSEAGPTRTILSLSKPDGWVPGENKVELAINGRTLRTAAFKVQ